MLFLDNQTSPWGFGVTKMKFKETTVYSPLPDVMIHLFQWAYVQFKLQSAFCNWMHSLTDQKFKLGEKLKCNSLL